MRPHLPLIAALATFAVVSCAGCAAASAATAVNKGQAAHSASPTAGQRLSGAVASVIKSDDGHAAVAVDDLTTGQTASYNGGDDFVTASIVKVDILSALLYQLQQSGESLSGEQQELATTMIENSDNDSASSLYGDAGGAAGVDEANRVFGLRETTAGAGPYWGLTMTSAADQVRLLRLVFTRPSVLTVTSQDYVQRLMGHVETDQQWGVPAAADHGTPFMVKNGWLPSPDTGRWEINSIGEVVHDHQRMLIAVLSDDNASEASGISVVEKVATKAADAISRVSRLAARVPAGPAA
jgi:beta-lactamase class A